MPPRTEEGAVASTSKRALTVKRPRAASSAAIAASGAAMLQRRCWLGVVSKEHVLRGVADGFAQVCHGKKAQLQRMQAGDAFIYYSPGTTMGSSDLRAFTAVGTIADSEVFQFTMSPDFKPFRRRVNYEKAARDVVLDAALKASLELCSKPSWGFALRRGLLELSSVDFEKIRSRMLE